jgi:hypothetical protein
MTALPPLSAATPDRILSIEDVAARFPGATMATVQQWMTSGPEEKRLSFFRSGDSCYVMESWLASFIARNMVNVPKCPPRTGSLEADAIQRAHVLIRELLRGAVLSFDEHGRLKVEPAPSPPPKEKGPQPDGQRAEENPTPVLNGVEP